MIWSPHVTVAALVEQDEHLLLVEERIDGRTVLNQPAGHLEDGESLHAAVVRETLEESGYHIHPEALTGLYRWRMHDGGRTYLRACFSATLLGHEPERPLDAAILGVRWLSPEQIRARRDELRSPLVLAAVEDYLSGRRYPLSLIRDMV